jgi:phage protein D/phage baseplate assembly protein gpV
MTRRSALPQIIVEVDGAPLEPQDARALAEVRVQQQLSVPSQCELAFRDPAGPLAAGSRLVPGAQLRVLVHGESEPLFAGEVTAVEYVYGPAHERETRVRGYDLLHRLRKRQSVHAHVQVTLRDLAQEMVADLGLSVQAPESGPQWQRLIQHRQSDLELLVELAERCGLYLALRGDRLYLHTLEGIGAPSRLVLGDSLLEARLELNGDPACRSVSAAGWDPLHVETHTGSAAVARVGRSVGADIAPGSVGGSGQRSLVDEVAPDDQHAQAMAQAELDARVAREVTFWGIAEGDPSLMPGAIADVAGLAAPLDGRYVLTAVTHTIDERLGFVSELSTAPPPQSRRPRGAVVAFGIVTRVDDPEGLGRVCVKLPTYEDVETDWMGVLCAGAGPDKGLIILPDVGDRVLVLFAREDPGEGIVLGGLYGTQKPPDSGVDGGSVRRYTLRTAGGHLVRFDDASRTIRVEDGSHSYVELSPDRVRLHASVDLDIEAPGRSVTIRGKTIDFESA